MPVSFKLYFSFMYSHQNPVCIYLLYHTCHLVLSLRIFYWPWPTRGFWRSKLEILRPFAIRYILPQGLPGPNPCTTNRDMLNYDKLAKPPRVTVTTWSVIRDCLLDMTSATSHMEVVSFHHQHDDAPFRGERKSFNMEHHLSLYALFS